MKVNRECIEKNTFFFLLCTKLTQVWYQPYGPSNTARRGNSTQSQEHSSVLIWSPNNNNQANKWKYKLLNLACFFATNSWGVGPYLPVVTGDGCLGNIYDSRHLNQGQNQCTACKAITLPPLLSLYLKMYYCILYDIEVPIFIFTI